MIVSIAADSAAAAGGSGRRRYLLDLSGLKTETGRLEIAWQDSELSFATVNLAESDDLQHWRPLVDRAVLVDLEFGGYRVATAGGALPASSSKWRVTSSRRVSIPFGIFTGTVQLFLSPGRIVPNTNSRRSRSGFFSTWV